MRLFESAVVSVKLCKSAITIRSWSDQAASCIAAYFYSSRSSILKYRGWMTLRTTFSGPSMRSGDGLEQVAVQGT
jgi:hypothetical protein